MVVDEFETGLAGMSVAVRPGGRLSAMIAIHLPTARLDAGLRADAVRELRELARRLEPVVEG